MLKIPACTLALLWLVYPGQQLSSHTAACSLPPPHQWDRGENQSTSENTCGLKYSSWEGTWRKDHLSSPPTSRPWKPTSSRPWLSSKTPSFGCWAWHYKLWSIYLPSLGQPSLLCPFPTPSMLTVYSLQGGQGQSGRKWESLEMHKLCSTTAKPTLCYQHSLSWPSKTQHYAAMKKGNSIPAESILPCSPPGSEQAGPFPPRFQL